MTIRHQRLIKLELNTELTQDNLDLNILLDMLAHEDIQIELDTLDPKKTQVTIKAFDDVLTDEMREVLDTMDKYIVQSVMVSDDL